MGTEQIEIDRQGSQIDRQARTESEAHGDRDRECVRPCLESPATPTLRLTTEREHELEEGGSR